MTKQDLIAAISRDTRADKETVSDIVESFMRVTKSAVVRGDSLFMRGFGTIGLKRRAPKKGRDILRKTFVNVPARYDVVLIPSDEWVDEVRKNQTPEQ